MTILEIGLPFSLTTGAITTQSNPDSQIAQHVNGLVATQPGERVMMGNYGVNTAMLLFEPDQNVVAQELHDNVASALTQWEPGALLKSVRIIQGNAGDGQATIAVDYTRSEAANTAPQLARNVNTATLRVGGTVDEVIRG